MSAILDPVSAELIWLYVITDRILAHERNLVILDPNSSAARDVRESIENLRTMLGALPSVPREQRN